jgi:hypothetical protein
MRSTVVDGKGPLLHERLRLRLPVALLECPGVLERGDRAVLSEAALVPARKLTRIQHHGGDLVLGGTDIHATPNEVRVKRVVVGLTRDARGRTVDDAEQRPDRQIATGEEPGRSCSHPQASIPISRRRPPLPWRTSSDPRRGSRSGSASASASWMRNPPRQSTTIKARNRQP